jgi:hypothetical protein
MRELALLVIVLSACDYIPSGAFGCPWRRCCSPCQSVCEIGVAVAPMYNVFVTQEPGAHVFRESTFRDAGSAQLRAIELAKQGFRAFVCSEL